MKVIAGRFTFVMLAILFVIGTTVSSVAGAQSITDEQLRKQVSEKITKELGIEYYEVETKEAETYVNDLKGNSLFVNEANSDIPEYEAYGITGLPAEGFEDNMIVINGFLDNSNEFIAVYNKDYNGLGFATITEDSGEEVTVTFIAEDRVETSSLSEEEAETIQKNYAVNMDSKIEKYLTGGDEDCNCGPEENVSTGEVITHDYPWYASFLCSIAGSIACVSLCIAFGVVPVAGWSLAFFCEMFCTGAWGTWLCP